MDKKTEAKIMDILRRYGNFVDGYDADGDELDIDEAHVAILSIIELMIKEGD